MATAKIFTTSSTAPTYDPTEGCFIFSNADTTATHEFEGFGEEEEHAISMKDEANNVEVTEFDGIHPRKVQ